MDDAVLGPGDAAFAGQREYTPTFLRVYDPLVLGLYCRRVWRCPARRLLDLYSRNLSDDHLDVGPGTGYFLRRAGAPPSARLTLVDPNRDVLEHAARRLADRKPTLARADVCRPLPLDRRFASVGANLLLHCLPTGSKAAAVRHLAAVVADDGVLFGATVLGEPRVHTRLSRGALRALNRRGAFDNLADTEAGVGRLLRDAFDDVEVSVTGAVAVFEARGPEPVA